MKNYRYLTLLLCFSAISATSYADGEFANQTPKAAAKLEGSSGEAMAAATGHYARSKSLLIEAIREFDRGTKFARPDSLLDTEEWRSSLISRAEDLERILAPQPRSSKGGVKLEANTKLLNVTNK